MSAATSTILGGLAIAGSIGGSVVGAKIASNTAKHASQIQVDASNKAMDYQQQSQARAMDFLNQQQNRPLQPMGGAAFGQLSSRTGGGAYGGLIGGQLPQSPGQQPSKGYTGPNPTGGSYRTLLGQPSIAGVAGAAAQSAAGAAPAGVPAPGGMPSAPGGAPGGAPSGGMVMLRAPTGETGSFPPDVAQQLISRGAVRVS